MATRLVGAVVAFAASAALTVGAAGYQPPDGGPKKGPPGKDKKGDRKGGRKGFELGRVLPPHVVDELDLTADQQKKLAELEREVKGKLEKLLTADQIKRLDEIGPPPGGPGGPGGGRGGPPPMPGEKGGPPPGDRDD